MTQEIREPENAEGNKNKTEHMRKRVLLAYKERKMKLKVCVTKIHSVEVSETGLSR